MGTFFLKKYTFLRLWYFFLPSGYPVNSIFQWSDSCFQWSIFSINCENAYGHQNFQGGGMLKGALIHKYAWHLNGVVYWGRVRNKIHISTYRRCMDTKLANCWLNVRGSQTWPFDQVTKVSSRDRLENLYLHFRKVYSE